MGKRRAGCDSMGMTVAREARRRAIRVLVVDDSNLIREALGNFVADLPGVEVVGRARDGLEALDLARARAPDVVITDLRMPRVDSFAATRLLKRSARPPAVVLCTTEDDDETRRAAADAGADALLLKRDLGSRVERLIRSLADPTALALNNPCHRARSSSG